MRSSLEIPTAGFLGNLAASLIENLKIYLVVKPLQLLVPSKPFEEKLQRMRSLPKHTVGNDLAKMLDAKGLKLIPCFEQHDLHHLILDYGMGSEEELCMQAYLIGNGYYRPQCFVFFASGILLPRLWKTFWAHYQLGKRNVSLSSLAMDECLTQSTAMLRKKYASASLPTGFETRSEPRFIS